MAEGELVNRFVIGEPFCNWSCNWWTVLQFEQNVLCITIAYLRSLAFKVGELDQIFVPNRDEVTG